MLYQTGNLVLSEIRKVRDNEDYRISVCKDLNTSLGTQYVLTVIKNKDLKVAVMQCMEGCEENGAGEQPWVACFVEEQNLCYVFPYEKQRKFGSFAAAQLVDTYSWEQAAINLVVACMSNPWPYPLLYLLINEDTVNINRDNTIYFTNFFRLEHFALKVSEVDCVERCSVMVLDMLQHAGEKRVKKLKSLALIEKKVEHGAYRAFSEIYKDIKYCAIPSKKVSIFKRFFAYVIERKDNLFKVLLTVSIVLFIAAFLMLVAQLVFGNAAFFKLGYSIDQIGTEQMTQ